MTDQHASRGRPATTDDDIDLQRLWALLVDGRWLILGAALLAFVLGLVYVQMAVPIYKAEGLLQIEKKQGGMLGLDQLDRALGGAESPTAAEIAILRSRMVLGEVVDQLRLDTRITPQSLPLIGRFQFAPGVVDDAGRAVPASVRDGDATVVVAEFQVPEAYRGRTFQLRPGDGGQPALYLGDRLIASGPADQPLTGEDGQVVLRLATWEPAGETFNLTRLSMLSAVNGIRGSLTVEEQGRDTGMLNISLTGPDPARARAILNAISQAYLMQNVKRQAAEAENSLEFLNEQLPEVRDTLNEAEEKLNAYRSDSDSVDINMETQSLLGRLVQMDAKLNDLKIKESEVAARYTKEHPAYRTLLEQRRSLEAQKARLNDQIGDLPETQQEILRLMRDVEVDQQLYVSLLNRAQELRILKASTVGNVRIIDDAVVYPGAVAPKKRLILALCTGLGFLFTAAVVLAAGLLRRGIESPDELEELGIPVYAAVPLSEEQARRDRVADMLRRRKRRTHGQTAPLLAVNDPGDLAVEALRSLRTSLHFATMEASNKVLMISGPSPEVGKSFITANLATVLAQVGQKVAVVDADMRKGHLHRYFGHDGQQGLSTILSGQADLDTVMAGTDIENLDFLPRGQVPPNPSELLMHPRFKQLVEDLSQRYDLVLVDTPPVLAVTDAAIIGQLAGTSLLVARFGQNSVKEVDVSINRFDQNKVEIKGVILNCIERRASNEYGYYAYKYDSKD